MRNDLNSILIEGTILRKPILGTSAEGKPVCSFTIESVYCIDDSENCENCKRKISYFNIKAHDRLAEVCVAKGIEGRMVRVIGRLEEEDSSTFSNDYGKPLSKIVIIPDHVEFKAEGNKTL